MKNAIIIGASSGIGKALAGVLAQNEYRLGLTGRRVELLEEIKQNLPEQTIIKQMDVMQTTHAVAQFNELVEEMGGVDLVIISAGIGHQNAEIAPDLELETIETNVSGFTVLAGAAFKHFKSKGTGHLVGISSILALRGNPVAPAYSASKAYMSNYLEGLRIKAMKEELSITCTDIRPGFVDTKMANGDHVFWCAPPEKAAAQIFDAIKAKKSCAYITKRWRLIAFLLRILPGSLYKKL